MHPHLVSKTTARSGSSTCELNFQPFTAYWQPILVDPDAHDFYVLRLSSPQEEWHPQVSQLPMRRAARGNGPVERNA